MSATTSYLSPIFFNYYFKKKKESALDLFEFETNEITELLLTCLDQITIPIFPIEKFLQALKLNPAYGSLFCQIFYKKNIYIGV